MADGGGGGNAFLGVMVGGLVVVVAVLGYIVFGGGMSGSGSKSATINIEVPKAGK
jgi:hypothetical protein